MKELDLHGLTYAQAEDAVERFINDNWGEQSAKIITGHSQAMRDVVINILDDYEADYVVGNLLGTDTSFIGVDLS